MRNIADLPLHFGTCPKWLFVRMKELSKIISQMIISEYGKKEFLKRLADPYFFQAFGCAVGFDWHSSGLTTTLTAALKESNLEEFGIFVFGGKGKIARNVPDEIDLKKEIFKENTEKIKYISKLVARIDNYAVQDGFDLYHHSLFVTENLDWLIIQQGMNEKIGYARRYHWLSFELKRFEENPHYAIVCDIKTKTLNFVSKENRELRKSILDFIKDDLKRIYPNNSLVKYLKMPNYHLINIEDYKQLANLKNFEPKNFEELIMIKGINAKILRSLALISKLIYGTEIDWKDPAKFSFTVGGKDGTPYKINRKHYDSLIQFLKDAIKNSNLKESEKVKALKRLASLEL